MNTSKLHFLLSLLLSHFQPNVSFSDYGFIKDFKGIYSCDYFSNTSEFLALIDSNPKTCMQFYGGGCLYFQLNKEYYVVQIFLHDQPDEDGFIVRMVDESYETTECSFEYETCSGVVGSFVVQWSLSDKIICEVIVYGEIKHYDDVLSTNKIILLAIISIFLVFLIIQKIVYFCIALMKTEFFLL